MARDDVVVGFIGLGIMGGRMPPTCKRPATSWSSMTYTDKRPVIISMTAQPGQIIRALSLAPAT